MADDPIKAIDRRVTALETRDAIDLVHREHVNSRLTLIDARMENISAKMDEGFEKIYASLRWPAITVGAGLLVAIVAWIANGGMAT